MSSKQAGDDASGLAGVNQLQSQIAWKYDPDFASNYCKRIHIHALATSRLACQSWPFSAAV
jgi:hypothetical protein